MKQAKKYSYLIAGILWLGVGILLIVQKQLFVVHVSIIFSLILLIIGLGRLTKAVAPNRERNFRQRGVIFITGIIDIILALIHYVTRFSLPTVLSKAIGIYQLFIGMSMLINWYLLRKDRVSGRIGIFLASLINFIWGVSSLLVESSHTVDEVVARLGFYLMFVGATILMDARDFFISEGTKNRVKRRIRVPLPVIFSILLPKNILDKINRFIQSELSTDAFPTPERKQSEIEPVLKVFIHVGEEGFNQMGHVDLSYKGMIYAYGNYDGDSERLFGAIGDGMLFSLKEQDYLSYCMADNKLLFEYQVVLTKEQEVQFEAKLNEILENAYRWEPRSPSQMASYLGRMTQLYEVHCYKFTESRYKTYFVLGTNCVLLADQLIGTSGLDLIAMVGILAPGTYYEYFENEYQKPNSIVIGKVVHHPHFSQQSLVAEV